MPLFEFQCRKCGHHFEELMSAAAATDAKVKCPACGSQRTERGFSAFATGSGGNSGLAGGSQGGGCGGSGGFT